MRSGTVLGSAGLYFTFRALSVLCLPGWSGGRPNLFVNFSIIFLITFFIDFYAPRLPADPFARSVFIRSLYARSVLTSAMRMLTPWDPGLGTRDPRKGPRSLGPRGARGPFGPPGQGRLRRPWGPWGPLGLFRGYSEWVLFCGKLLWGGISK